MKIVSIFGHKLFAFRYPAETDNELSRILKEWNDTYYLYNFISNNKGDIPKNKNIAELVNQLIEDANEIDETLIMLSKNKTKKLEAFFKPLDNQEYRICHII